MTIFPKEILSLILQIMMLLDTKGHMLILAGCPAPPPVKLSRDNKTALPVRIHSSK
jgi:hypothetical protein